MVSQENKKSGNQIGCISEPVNIKLPHQWAEWKQQQQQYHTYWVDNKTMPRFCLEVFVVSVFVILFFASFGCANIKSFINAQPGPKLTTPGGDTWVTTTIAATTGATSAAALKQWSNRRNLTGDLDTAVDPWRWQKKSQQNQGKTKTISLRSVVEN